ncbi:MAG: hypothetical protein AAFW73_12120 [Bacteroidota bacterium]
MGELLRQPNQDPQLMVLELSPDEISDTAWRLAEHLMALEEALALLAGHPR